MASTVSNGALIERTELVERLASQPVVVIAAPAGHGASSLLLQLGSVRHGPTVVVRCTDADAFGGLAARVLGALTTEFPLLDEDTPVTDTTGAARLAYALPLVAGPATLVVDDLHLVEAQAANEVVDAIARHAPDDVGLIVSTHGDPLPSLARAVAMRGGVVVDAHDLLFSAEECAEIATRCGSSITPDELLERSGGWPLAVTALARGGVQLSPALGAELLDSLGPEARGELAGVAQVASVPVAVVSDGPVGDELLAFAARHPAAVDMDGGRFGVRPLLQSVAGSEPDAVLVADLADRLERHGEQATALLLLSRVPGSRTLLQDRLAVVGPGLLDSGRHRLVHEVVGRIPGHQRRVDILVLDAAARLGLQQLEALADDHLISDESVAALARRDDLDDDLRLALAGLRTDVLRRNGDQSLVAVALEGLGPVGPLGPDVDVLELVQGRSALARRGLHLLLYGLGAAALFSGDAAMIAEGRRLQELSLGVAERTGIDTVVLRAQMVFEWVSLGLVRPSEALAPLEGSVTALRARGHPEAANHLAQLADIHVRLVDVESALAAVESGRDWAERTGNALVAPSLEVLSAVSQLLRDGPDPGVDRALLEAWEHFIAARRLRRIAPTVAARIAGGMIDAGDADRAQVWIDRSQSMLAERLQGTYQGELLEALRQRLQVLRRAELGGPPRLGVGFEAQPAGAAEHAATVAWDRLRRGDDSLVDRVLEQFGDHLDDPWPARLGRAPVVSEGDAGPEIVIRVLGPRLRLERNGRELAAPTGHAARLLVRLVVRDGSLSAEAAIEDLWPDSPVGGSRNRLHQVLHRTRRALGDLDSTVLSLDDGVLRLDLERCSSDVVALRSLATLGPTDPDRRRAAVDLLGRVESSLCSAQFAHDESLDDDRWDVDRRVVELAVALIDSVPGDGEARRVGWQLWDRFPEQWEIGEALERSALAAGDDLEAARARRRGDGG